MRTYFIKILSIICLVLLPIAGLAQGQDRTQIPPIAQPLVREGEFAVRLANALGLGTTNDEVEAESILGADGISPRNGWIADYPMTPDIVDEIRSSVIQASDSGRLGMGKDDALRIVDDVSVQFNMNIGPYSAGEAEAPPPSGANYPNPTVINNYYYNVGPPVVTYYPPPPGFFYLYSWVPYPFWCNGFFFTGFFVLHDFNRVIIRDRRAEIVTNHFLVPHRNRGYRIDPVNRLRGRTFGGIAPRTRDLVRIPRGPALFNHNRPIPKITPRFRGRGITPPPRPGAPSRIAPAPSRPGMFPRISPTPPRRLSPAPAPPRAPAPAQPPRPSLQPRRLMPAPAPPRPPAPAPAPPRRGIAPFPGR